MLRYLIFPVILITTALAARADDTAGYYQGKLGSKQTITMRINGEGAGIDGQYRYAKYGAPLWLSKVKNDNGDDITFQEMNPQAQEDPAGRFHGSLNDDNAFVGRWTSADGKRVLPFNLQRTADLLQVSSRTPKYKVQCSAPQFTSTSAFYTALNAKLAREARESHASSTAEFEKSTSDVDPKTASFPWERSTSIDIIYADENLVSLSYEVYEFDGGAHGNIGFDSAIYTWQNRKLVQLHTKDLFLPKSQASIDALVMQDLKRQQAPWTNKITAEELNAKTVNPTSAGLVITIPPYVVGPWADGTWTVMLPYKSLGEVIRPEGPLGRFSSAPHMTVLCDKPPKALVID